MLNLNLKSCWRQASRLPVTGYPCRVWLRTFLAVLPAFAALLVAHAQDTNTPSPQHSNTPAFQYSNTPLLQYSNTPSLQDSTSPSYTAVETNPAPSLPALYGPGALPLTPPGPLPAAGVPGIPPGDRFGGTSQLASAPPLSTADIISGGKGLFQWGPFHFYPHFTYQLTYGNGLQFSPGQQGDTFINQFSPGMLVQIGSHWSLDYTPTLRFYSDPKFQDGTDHAVSLSGGTTYEDWTFGLFQSYVRSSQPLIETAAQTSQDTYSTGLSASRSLSSKMSLDLGLRQEFLFLDNTVPSEQLTDRRSWSTMDWLNYQFWPKFSAGIGAGFTYDNLAVGPDMTSEQWQGRIAWRAGNKLSLVLSGGLNDMQFLGSNTPDSLSPIFSFSAQYQLFETTSFSVGASQAVSPSYYQDQVSEATGVNAGLHQRLLRRLYLDLGGAYSTSTYQASATSPVASNASNYDTTSFNVALSTTFWTRATAAIFYSVSYNSSGSAAYDYTTRQAGLSLGYHF